MTTLVAVLGASGAVIVGVLTYLATRRQTESTDEIALREEGRAMREELRNEVMMLRTRLAAIELDAETSRKAVVQLSVEVVALRTEIAVLKARQEHDG